MIVVTDRQHRCQFKEKKFSPVPWFEPGSPALWAGIEETFYLGPKVCLDDSLGRALECRAGDPGSNHGADKNFFLFKLASVTYRFSLLT